MSAAEGIPQIKDIVSAIGGGLQLSSVLGVYLLGSRLWGTHRASSDFDVYLLVPKYKEPKFTTTVVVRGVQVDATVCELPEFTDRIAIAKYPDILCCLAPPECVIMESSEVVDVRRKLKLEFSILCEQGLDISGKDWRRAQDLIDKGDIERGKKVLGHALRCLALYGHLCQKARAANVALCVHDLELDIRSYNAVHDCLDGIFARSWHEYELQFEPARASLLAILRDGAGADQDVYVVLAGIA